MIKIDVEGAEAQVLRGAASLLRERRPTVFLATHGERQQAECLALLAGWATGSPVWMGNPRLGPMSWSRPVRSEARETSLWN